jgi:Alginate lyase
MLKILPLVMAIGFTFQFLAGTAAGSSVSLTDAQSVKLTRLVHDDPEAAAQFAKVKQTADDALSAKPDPIPLIQTQGRLAGDPVKERTWKSLDDMTKLECLGYALAVTKHPVYADKIREYVLAWAGTNHSAGDPIDDTNLQGLLIGYDMARDSLSAQDQNAVDLYLRGVAEAEIKTGQSDAHTNMNNWNSHRLKVVGLIAFILHDRAMIDHTVKAYQRQIQLNLLPDGSSIDFHERDALRYHAYDLTPLLTVATAARNNGIDLYNCRAPSGSSLPAAVAFLIPFANGSQTHLEFVHSTVPLDRKRAENGQSEYKSGTMWDPHDAMPALERAELFDSSLLPLVIHLAPSKAKHFPTWQIVLNAVSQ